MQDDRVVQLESAVATLESRFEDTRSKLDQILDTVARLAQNTNAQPTPYLIPPDRANMSPQTENPPKTRKAKPASPPEFDGERTKGLAFLNSCQTYIRLCPEEFRDEQAKILWAMSYMKAGRAAKWAARIFRWEQLPDNSGSARFFDWEDFRDEFKKEFTPAHADSVAVNRLETTAYHQKSRSLDEYLDEFQDLITDSGYTDPKTIVVKFRRGLNTQIQNAVATMASGRPSDTSPDQWYEMARTVDQNRATNEAFQSAHRGPTSVAPRSANAPFARSVLPVPTFPQRHAHTTPTPGNPVPMDIDSARRKAMPAGACFRCGKPGHFGRDCPDRFDVRTWSVEELQGLLEDRLAQLDVAPMDPTSPADEELTNQEDFHNDNE